MQIRKRLIAIVVTPWFLTAPFAPCLAEVPGGVPFIPPATHHQHLEHLYSSGVLSTNTMPTQHHHLDHLYSSGVLSTNTSTSTTVGAHHHLFNIFNTTSSNSTGGSNTGSTSVYHHHFNDIASVSNATNSATSIHSGIMPSINLNLSSTVANVTAGHILQNQSVVINIAGVPTTVNANTLLTPAEKVAVYQVLGGHTQTITLDAQGSADGGVVVITPHLSQLLGSLTIPAGVTVIDLSKGGILNLTGNLVDDGNLYITANNPTLSTLTVDANNINVQNGGLLSDILPVGGLNGISNILSSVNLDLTAQGSITNAGTITSSGTLGLTAGSGDITNSGLIASTGGNINIVASNPATNINVSGTGGTFEALNGNINVGDVANNQTGNTTMTGGNYLSENLNINDGTTGAVNASVDQVTGTLNINAGSSNFTAATGTLNIGNENITGDPSFYNTSGNVDISGSLEFSGEDLAIVAEGNIVNTKSDDIISTASSVNGGNIVMIAGAQFTSTGNNSVPASGEIKSSSTGDTSSTLTITGGTSAGGYIDLTGGNGTGNGTTPISSLTSTGDGSGGNISLIAYGGTGTNAGTINVPSTVTINANGGVVGGNVVIIAGSQGSASTNAINVGPISTASTVWGPLYGVPDGAVTLVLAAPTFTTGTTQFTLIDNSNGSVTGSTSLPYATTATSGLPNSALQNTSMVVGAITSNSTLTLTSGTGNLGTSSSPVNTNASTIVLNSTGNVVIADTNNVSVSSNTNTLGSLSLTDSATSGTGITVTTGGLTASGAITLVANTSGIQVDSDDNVTAGTSSMLTITSPTVTINGAATNVEGGGVEIFTTNLNDAGTITATSSTWNCCIGGLGNVLIQGLDNSGSYPLTITLTGTIGGGNTTDVNFNPGQYIGSGTATYGTGGYGQTGTTYLTGYGFGPVTINTSGSTGGNISSNNAIYINNANGSNNNSNTIGVWVNNISSPSGVISVGGNTTIVTASGDLTIGYIVGNGSSNPVSIIANGGSISLPNQTWAAINVADTLSITATGSVQLTTNAAQTITANNGITVQAGGDYNTVSGSSVSTTNAPVSITATGDITSGSTISSGALTMDGNTVALNGNVTAGGIVNITATTITAAIGSTIIAINANINAPGQTVNLTQSGSDAVDNDAVIGGSGVITANTLNITDTSAYTQITSLTDTNAVSVLNGYGANSNSTITFNDGTANLTLGSLTFFRSIDVTASGSISTSNSTNLISYVPVALTLVSSGAINLTNTLIDNTSYGPDGFSSINITGNTVAIGADLVAGNASISGAVNITSTETTPSAGNNILIYNGGINAPGQTVTLAVNGTNTSGWIINEGTSTYPTGYINAGTLNIVSNSTSSGQVIVGLYTPSGPSNDVGALNVTAAAGPVVNVQLNNGSNPIALGSFTNVNNLVIDTAGAITNTTTESLTGFVTLIGTSIDISNSLTAGGLLSLLAGTNGPATNTASISGDGVTITGTTITVGGTLTSADTVNITSTLTAPTYGPGNVIAINAPISAGGQTVNLTTNSADTSGGTPSISEGGTGAITAGTLSITFNSAYGATANLTGTNAVSVLTGNGGNSNSNIYLNDGTTSLTLGSLTFFRNIDVSASGGINTEASTSLISYNPVNLTLVSSGTINLGNTLINNTNYGPDGFSSITLTGNNVVIGATPVTGNATISGPVTITALESTGSSITISTNVSLVTSATSMLTMLSPVVNIETGATAQGGGVAIFTTTLNDAGSIVASGSPVCCIGGLSNVLIQGLPANASKDSPLTINLTGSISGYDVNLNPGTYVGSNGTGGAGQTGITYDALYGFGPVTINGGGTATGSITTANALYINNDNTPDYPNSNIYPTTIYLGSYTSGDTSGIITAGGTQNIVVGSGNVDLGYILSTGSTNSVSITAQNGSIILTPQSWAGIDVAGTLSLTANGSSSNVVLNTVSNSPAQLLLAAQGINISAGNTFTLDAVSGTSLSTVNNNITVTSAALSINGAINAGTATVSLIPNGNQNVTVGGNGSASGFDVSQSALGNITAGTLVVGSSTDINNMVTGAGINVSGSGAGAYNLVFNIGGNFSNTGNTIDLGGQNLTVTAGGTVNTGTIDIAISNLVSLTGGKTLTVDGDITLGGSTTLALSGSTVNVNDAISTNSSIGITSTGKTSGTGITINAAISTPGAITLTTDQKGDGNGTNYVITETTHGSISTSNLSLVFSGTGTSTAYLLDGNTYNSNTNSVSGSGHLVNAVSQLSGNSPNGINNIYLQDGSTNITLGSFVNTNNLVIITTGSIIFGAGFSSPFPGNLALTGGSFDLTQNLTVVGNLDLTATTTTGITVGNVTVQANSITFDLAAGGNYSDNGTLVSTGPSAKFGPGGITVEDAFQLVLSGTAIYTPGVGNSVNFESTGVGGSILLTNGMDYTITNGSGVNILTPTLLGQAGGTATFVSNASTPFTLATGGNSSTLVIGVSTTGSTTINLNGAPVNLVPQGFFPQTLQLNNGVTLSATNDVNITANTINVGGLGSGANATITTPGTISINPILTDITFGLNGPTSGTLNLNGAINNVSTFYGNINVNSNTTVSSVNGLTLTVYPNTFLGLVNYGLTNNGTIKADWVQINAANVTDKGAITAIGTSFVQAMGDYSGNVVIQSNAFGNTLNITLGTNGSLNGVNVDLNPTGFGSVQVNSLGNLNGTINASNALYTDNANTPNSNLSSIQIYVNSLSNNVVSVGGNTTIYADSGNINIWSIQSNGSDKTVVVEALGGNINVGVNAGLTGSPGIYTTGGTNDAVVLVANANTGVIIVDSGSAITSSTGSNYPTIQAISNSFVNNGTVIGDWIEITAASFTNGTNALMTAAGSFVNVIGAYGGNIVIQSNAADDSLNITLAQGSTINAIDLDLNPFSQTGNISVNNSHELNGTINASNAIYLDNANSSNSNTSTIKFYIGDLSSSGNENFVSVGGDTKIEAANGNINVWTVQANGKGNVELTADNGNVTVGVSYTSTPGVTTHNGTVTITANGNFTVEAGSTVTTGSNNAITVTANDIYLADNAGFTNGSLNAGTGTVTLLPYGNTENVIVGAKHDDHVLGDFNVTGQALGNITAGTLVIGRLADSGNFNVTGPVNVSSSGAGAYNLKFYTGGIYTNSFTITLGDKNLYVDAIGGAFTGVVKSSYGNITINTDGVLTVNGNITVTNAGIISLTGDTVAVDNRIKSNGVTGITSTSDKGGTGITIAAHINVQGAGSSLTLTADGHDSGSADVIDEISGGRLRITNLVINLNDDRSGQTSTANFGNTNYVSNLSATGSSNGTHDITLNDEAKSLIIGTLTNINTLMVLDSPVYLTGLTVISGSTTIYNQGNIYITGDVTFENGSNFDIISEHDIDATTRGQINTNGGNLFMLAGAELQSNGTIDLNTATGGHINLSASTVGNVIDTAGIFGNGGNVTLIALEGIDGSGRVNLGSNSIYTAGGNVTIYSDHDSGTGIKVGDITTGGGNITLTSASLSGKLNVDSYGDVSTNHFDVGSTSLASIRTDELNSSSTGIDPNAGSITITGTSIKTGEILAEGADGNFFNVNGGNGGAVTLTASTSIVTALINTFGGNGANGGLFDLDGGDGGKGGNVELTAVTTISVKDINTSGGNGESAPFIGSGGSGGDAGNITLTATSTTPGVATINVNSIVANGGNGGNASTLRFNSSCLCYTYSEAAGNGGSGGNVILSAGATSSAGNYPSSTFPTPGTTILVKSITTDGGKGGNGEEGDGGNGGNGGNVTLTATTVTATGDIKSDGGHGGIGLISNGGNGGNGGSIAITANTISSSNIFAIGGNGGKGELGNGGNGGDGGSITLLGANSSTIAGSLIAAGGNGGRGIVGNGGNGGNGGDIIFILDGPGAPIYNGSIPANFIGIPADVTFSSHGTIPSIQITGSVTTDGGRGGNGRDGNGGDGGNAGNMWLSAGSVSATGGYNAVGGSGGNAIALTNKEYDNTVDHYESMIALSKFTPIISGKTVSCSSLIPSGNPNGNGGNGGNGGNITIISNNLPNGPINNNGGNGGSGAGSGSTGAPGSSGAPPTIITNPLLNPPLGGPVPVNPSQFSEYLAALARELQLFQLFEQIGTRVATDYDLWLLPQYWPKTQPLQGEVEKLANNINGTLFAGLEFSQNELNTLAGGGVEFGPNSNKDLFELMRGNVFFMPKHDIRVKTREGIAYIPKGCVAWIMETGADSAIYDCHDNIATGRIKVEVNGKKLALAPGTQVLLTKDPSSDFASLNPGYPIGYRNVASADVGNGVKVYVCSFSLPHIMANIPVIHDLLKSEKPESIKVANAMIKNAVILNDLTGSEGYQTNMFVASKQVPPPSTQQPAPGTRLQPNEQLAQPGPAPGPQAAKPMPEAVLSVPGRQTATVPAQPL